MRSIAPYWSFYVMARCSLKGISKINPIGSMSHKYMVRPRMGVQSFCFDYPCIVKVDALH